MYSIPKTKQKDCSNPYANSLQKVCIEKIEGEGVVARILNEFGQPTSVYVPYKACIKYDLLLPEDRAKLIQAENSFNQEMF
jgi:hypothetical protein